MATVVDAMLHRPLVSPVGLTTGQARAVLQDDHLHAVLVIDTDGILLTVLERGDLDPDQDPGASARLAGRLDGRTVAPDADLERTRLHLVRTGRRRLAVVDSEHRLLGLLCLTRTGLGFCSDADVEARAAERAGTGPQAG